MDLAVEPIRVHIRYSECNTVNFGWRRLNNEWATPELARKRAGVSLRGLTDALGGQPRHQAIRKHERGEMTPSSSVLVALAEALGVSIDFS